MATLERAVKELQNEQQRLQKELERVTAALGALSTLNGHGRGRGRATNGRRRRGTRRMSAAGRRRIAAAQKARWAKLRQERSKKAA